MRKYFDKLEWFSEDGSMNKQEVVADIIIICLFTLVIITIYKALT